MEKELGVLCHVTSLPSKFGIGDFGKPCYDFIDFLSKNNINVWQILPLNHANEFNCPYGAQNSFAFDEMFADLTCLKKWKLIKNKDLKELRKLENTEKVNYKIVKEEKLRLLTLAHSKLNNACVDELHNFVKDYPHIFKYAYFKTLLEVHQTNNWLSTPKELWDLESESAKEFSTIHSNIVDKYIFFQLILHEQWQKVKAYANSKNVKILGDLPIYLEKQSADVFLNPKAFLLDENFENKIGAGVPPDEFNANGQDWGTCVYDWKFLEKTKFEYLVEKIKVNLKNFDVLRLDHFAGYVEHFEIENHDIKNGKWVKAGGERFFKILESKVDLNKLVVEDLGTISEECLYVKHKFDLKGMNILQFAYDGNKNNPHLPENVKENSIYYLGTHDNNTFIGYISHICDSEKETMWGNKTNQEVLVEQVKEMLNSKAKTVVLQMQDFLMQGEKYRMNVPGQTEHCWEYRAPKHYKKVFKNTLNKINWKICR